MVDCLKSINLQEKREKEIKNKYINIKVIALCNH